jgi:hypothetical protein
VTTPKIYQCLRPKTTRFIELMFVLSLVAFGLYLHSDIVFLKWSGFLAMIVFYGLYKNFRPKKREIAIKMTEEKLFLYPPLCKKPLVIARSDIIEIFETKHHEDIKYDFRLRNGKVYVFRPYAFGHIDKTGKLKAFLEKHLMKVYERR